MQQYKISEESYNKYRKKWFVIGVPVISAVISIFIWIVIYSQKEAGGFNPLPYLIPIFVLWVSFSIFRGLKRQRRLLLSYSVTISDDDITREQLNTPPLTVNFMEIKEILKTRKGGFMIKGRTRTDIIYIPHLIDDAPALEKELGKFAPITANVRESRQRGIRLALAALTLAGFLTIFLSNNMLIIGISGVVVCGAFIFRIIELLTNKSVPTNLKRRCLIYVLIVAFVIYTMYTKLMIPAY